MHIALPAAYTSHEVLSEQISHLLLEQHYVLIHADGHCK